MITWTVRTMTLWVVLTLKSGGRNMLEGCRAGGLGWKMKDAHPKRRYTPITRCKNPQDRNIKKMQLDQQCHVILGK